MEDSVKFKELEGFLYESQSNPLLDYECKFKFDNGYGASVIKFKKEFNSNSLGLEPMYELAVIKFNNDGSFEIDYENNVTDDVIKGLDFDKVKDYLNLIRLLG